MTSGRRIALAVVAAAACLAGCNSTGCLDNGSSLPLAGFYSSTTLQEISIDSMSIAGVGAPSDSVLMKPGKASSVYLPMNSAAESVTWLLTYEYKEMAALGLTDEITLHYRPFTYFASEACGAMYAFRVTGISYTRNLIDSVGIVDSLFTNTDVERIKIFFRTADAEEGSQR